MNICEGIRRVLNSKPSSDALHSLARIEKEAILYVEDIGGFERKVAAIISRVIAIVTHVIYCSFTLSSST